MSNPLTSRTLIAATLAALLCGLPLCAEAKDGRNGAALGGLAVGAVGGLLLGQALQGQDAAPAPAPVEVEPEPVPVRRPLPVVDEDPSFRKATRLRRACDDGSRQACIRFGIIIGQNREREAQWRREEPDMFAWDND